MTLLGAAALLLCLAAPASAAPGLVAAYSFNEGSGSVAHDSAGSHDGTVEGATWKEGKYGSALEFDGEDDLVSIADANDLDLTGSFTIEAWLRPHGEQEFQPATSKWEEGVGGYVLWASTGAIRPYGAVRGASAAKTIGAESGALPGDTWSHLTMTSDGGTLRLYVDGELVGSEEGVPVAASEADLLLGRYAARYFDGLIDEVRIYDSALDEAQIAMEMASSTPVEWLSSLCDTAESLCAVVNQYPWLTSLKGSSDGFTFKRGLLKYTCTDSELDLRTGQANEPVTILVTEWTTSDCTANLGFGNCTVVPQFESEVSDGGIAWSEVHDGTFALFEGSIYVHCEDEEEATTVDCTYSFENGPTLDVKGGNPSSVVGEAAPFTVTASGPKACSTGDGSAELTADFMLQEPAALYLAPPAPGHFEAEPSEWKGQSILSGTSDGWHFIPAFGNPPSCEAAVLQGIELEEPSETITATPAYSGCSQYLFGSFTIDTDGCEYALDAGFVGQGSLDIVNCNGAGITYTIGSGKCKYTIPPQTDIGPVGYTTMGSGDKREIELDLDGVAVEFEYEDLGGLGCNGEGTTNGQYDGAWDVSAVNEGEEQIGTWLDTRPTQTVITDGPEGTVLPPDVTFKFWATEPAASFECSFDEVEYAPCTSPQKYEDLQEGQHTFRVVATDAAGNKDKVPAERSFGISNAPETTITSPTPSYTSHEKPPIEFASSDPNSTFKCSLDDPEEEPTEDCTSPYSLPAELSPGWHTFVVAATDEYGFTDQTPAKWTFNTAIYPPAPESSKLVSPDEGTKTASHYTLRASWGEPPEGGGVSGVTFQLKLASWDRFRTISSQYVRDANGNQVSWPIAVGENPGETSPVFLDFKAYSEAKSWGANQEKLQLRAVFDGGVNAAGASEPVTTDFSYTAAPSPTTESIGPATVDLVTGQHTISRTDVSIPVPGSQSNLEFTRVYDSSYMGNSEVGKGMSLGGMWQPSTPAEADYEEQAWKSLVVRHRPAVPPVYEEECWEEEGFPKECEKWMVEAEIPEANWVEVLDDEGVGIPFDKVGSSYVAPKDAKEWKLTKPEGKFLLVDPNGTRTVFTQNPHVSSEYLPSTVSWQATPSSARMVYETKESNLYEIPLKVLRLKMIIAPSPAGVTCNDTKGEGNYAPETPGCRSLTFQYFDCGTCEVVVYYEQAFRLSSITYHNSTGSGSQVVSEYAYDVYGRMSEQWDPRISPNLKEAYAYGPYLGNRWDMVSLTPPGEEAWDFDYYAREAVGASKRLKTVSRASLLEEGPETATTTIAYDVPISGEGAPYDLSPESVAEWSQGDYPVNATAVFPPTQVPGEEPPSDYSQATVHYMDPDGYEVNAASPAPPGVEGDAITTSETDVHGNAVRELSARNRLIALADEDPIERAKELDSHSTYNEDGTRELESWGPLRQVRLEDGETVEARTHTTTEYDKGAPEPKEDETWPNLPTKEMTGAAIPGQEADKDVRVSETKYDWDLRLPIEEIVDPDDGTGSPELNLITKTVYDSNGLVVESRQPSDTEGEDAGTTVNAYYSAGAQSPVAACRNKPQWANLPCVSYPKAEPSPAEGNPKLPWTWTTSYNSLDLPTETEERVDGELKRTTTAIYDAAGRPLQSHETGEGIELPPSETLYSESTGAPVGQRLVCEEECEGFDEQTVTTTFDALGRPIEYEDADGNVSGVAYDLLGRNAVISDGKGVQTATYDEESGVLTQMEDPAAGAFTATYDADGQMVEASLPNGLAVQATYDQAGTPVGLTYEKTLCSEDCTWLEFDREESIHGQVLKQESTLSTQEYTYDAAGRLIQAKDTEEGKCTTRSYSFDANTNRTKLITREPGEGGACDVESEGEVQEYDYDTADRLIDEGVEYDTLGRITDLPSEFSGGGKLTTSYYVNDLTRSQTQGEITNTYELDSTGRQRERTRVKGEEESTEIYHYSGPSDSPAWIDLGESWTRSIPGIGGNLGAIQDSATGEITLQLSDMHGDIVATADIDPEATELLSTQQFDEYGNPKSKTTAAKFGWLGAKNRRTELPSGVVQMGVRSYVPALGRFLSPDPIPGGSANAYEYAEGDPVNNFDLTGEKCGGRCKKIRRLKRRARRMARRHGLRRLARKRGRRARASAFILAPFATRLGRDVADKVGYVAGKLADSAFRAAKQAAEHEVRSKAAMVRYVMDSMKKAGNWTWAHRKQIAGCAKGAAEGWAEARYLTAAGPKGTAAVGLYMAVRCGIAFIP